MWQALAGLVLVTMAASGRGSAIEARPDSPVGQSFPSESLEFFESQVRPVLMERCVKCHGPKKQSSGLRLDSRAAVLKGGDNGPAVVPAKPDDSRLIQAVSQTHGELKMPPDGKLPEPAVASLRQWVAPGGAVDGHERQAGDSNSPGQPKHW